MVATAPPETIVEHLLTGGASDLHIDDKPLWIVGHTPSGTLFELYWWPEQGYYVSRRDPSGQAVQQLGVFPAWPAAVRCALQV